MLVNLKVTVKNKLGEWTEEWKGYNSSITQAEAVAREAITQFNEIEKDRYGDKGDQREFVSVEIVTPTPPTTIEEEDDD